VVLAQPEDDIVLVTKRGMSIRFPSKGDKGIREHQRAAGGVRGIKLQRRDEVVAMDVATPEDKLLIATQKGLGKISNLRHYRQQRRGGMGIKTLDRTPKTGNVAAAQVIREEDRVFLITEQAQVIILPLDEIRHTGRVTQGVKLANLQRGDAVSGIRAVGARRTPAATLPEAPQPEDDSPGDSDEDNGDEGNGDGVEQVDE
jgi:DNA gyrase subunit A